MPISTGHTPQTRPIDRAIRMLVDHHTTALLDREAVSIVSHDTTAALRLALAASEMRAALAAEVVP